VDDRRALTGLLDTSVFVAAEQGRVREFARIVAAARKGGRRPRALDALIAATASSLGVPVYTQDADFEDMPGVEVVRV
jgi:predicted nucleic acid-binding protein